MNLGKIFQAMSDPTRRRILEMLRAGDLAAGQIADAFQMTKPAISHHLSVLKEAGLAVERREGQKVIYSLEPGSIVEVWDGFLSKLCKDRKKKKRRSEA
jgi:DNA-binding transcriptional ArsR family regulator